MRFFSRRSHLLHRDGHASGPASDGRWFAHPRSCDHSLLLSECDEEDDVRTSSPSSGGYWSRRAPTSMHPPAATTASLRQGFPTPAWSKTQTDIGEERFSGNAQVAPIWYAEQGSCDDTFNAQVWRSEHKLVKINSDHEGYLVLRSRRYPAWQITVDGNPPRNFPSVKTASLSCQFMPVHLPSSYAGR